MNRIETLLAELCPDGICFRAIGEIAKCCSGATPKSEVAAYRENGTIPWMRSGEVNKGTVHSSEEANSDFIFHYLQTQYQKLREISSGNGTRGGLNIQTIRDYKIPLPPLAIRQEIAIILDKFAELQAELQARRVQYAYYRDKLLAFDASTPGATTQATVKWMTLAEIGQFIRGRRFTKADYVDEGISVIHYGEIYTRYGVWADHAISSVRPDMAGMLRYAKPGDVVITDVGETVDDVGKAVAWLGNDDVAIHDHCYAFRNTMNPKFVSYCMQTSAFIAQKAKYVARTKVNTLLIDGFAKIRIPVPPQEQEQERIVSILDQFDTLTHSLSEGLPREITLRKQQYEYCRDRLLTFRESA